MEKINTDLVAIIFLHSEFFAHSKSYILVNQVVSHLLKHGAKNVFLIDVGSASKHSHNHSDGLKQRSEQIYCVSAKPDDLPVPLVKRIIADYQLGDKQLLIVQSKLTMASDYLGTSHKHNLTVHLNLTHEKGTNKIYELSESGQVTNIYDELPKKWNDGYGFGGSLLITSQLVDQIPTSITHFDHFLFDWAKQKDKLAGLPLGGHRVNFLSLPSDEDLYQFESWINRRFKPCLFLDRDGVLIKDTGYPHKTQDVHICYGLLPILKWAEQQAWQIAVVSNQAGVAKGIFSFEEYSVFTGYLKQVFVSHGVQIKQWFACPYDPKGSVQAYALQSHLRKPQPGMVLKAMDLSPIDIKRSVMIGDKYSDKMHYLNLTTLFIRGDYPLPPEVCAMSFSSYDDLFVKLQNIAQ